MIQSNHPKIVVHSPDPKAKATLDPRSARKIKAVRISYHRRLYGLGEHYNSLRKITYSLSAFSAMVCVAPSCRRRLRFLPRKPTH